MPEETKAIVVRKKDIDAKHKVNIDKDVQYNAQDLDQEQAVDVKPVQMTYVNVNRADNYASKICGTTMIGSNKQIIADVSIHLYFGHMCKQPVYKTNSDRNGNYVIENIPAGFYTIHARLANYYQYQSAPIKVLPCQTVEHVVTLQ